MTDNVINAFGRKAGDPAPVVEAPEVKICQRSLILAKELVRQVEAGEITNLGAIALANGYPMTAIARAEGENVAILSMLNLTVDTLKAMIFDRVEDYMRPATITEETPEEPK